MKLTITGKKENKLLKRTELAFEVSHASEATPKRMDMRNAIAAKQACEPELVVISKFKTSYGTGKSKGVAHQYKKAEDLKLIEPKYIIKRYTEKPVAKKEEKPAEEAPAEKQPAEAQKEEAPDADNQSDSKRAEDEPAQKADASKEDKE
jgi:small subunit ribosomal protein S24e